MKLTYVNLLFQNMGNSKSTAIKNMSFLSNGNLLLRTSHKLINNFDTFSLLLLLAQLSWSESLLTTDSLRDHIDWIIRRRGDVEVENVMTVLLHCFMHRCH